MPDITIDGTSISGVTIDGTKVQEVTIDGNVAWTAINTIDSFEDNDISEYGGNTGAFSTSSNRSKDGTYSLYSSSDGADYIYSTSGLNYYPSSGDTIKHWYYRSSTNVNAQFRFAVQSTASNNYTVNYNHGDDHVLKSNGNAIASNTNIGGATGWLQNIISWGSSGGITCTLEDSNGNQLSQISATDTTHSSGGVGFKMYKDSGASGHIYFDHARVP